MSEGVQTDLNDYGPSGSFAKGESVPPIQCHSFPKDNEIHWSMTAFFLNYSCRANKSQLYEKSRRKQIQKEVLWSLKGNNFAMTYSRINTQVIYRVDPVINYGAS